MPRPYATFLHSFFLFVVSAFALSLGSGCGDPGNTSTCEGDKCDEIGTGSFDLYTPGNRFGWGGEDEYLDEIQPILAKRCVVCHGCSDSPCQLKLSSFEGLLRGSNENNVFAKTVTTQDPNRLKDGRVVRSDGTIDHAATESNWRGSDYYSVTDGAGSLMQKLLEVADVVREEGRDEALMGVTHDLYQKGLKNLEFECVGANNAGTLGGDDLRARAMPFGLEPLEKGDFEKVVDWIRRGAPGPSDESQRILRTPRSNVGIEKWETFLNGEQNTALDLKRYLVARYLFEHMFAMHIAFDDSPGEFYEMVRSTTPPGIPVDEIVTEYVMDDPGTGRVFYRFRKLDEVIVRKTHTVWDLNDEVLAHYDELFMQGITPAGTIDYQVTEDPGYSVLGGDGSRNPFRYFSQIPGVIRSQFMMENGKNLIETLMKSDVCTGSTATYAIRDHFWVWFLKPTSDPTALYTDRISESLIGWDLNPFAMHSILETESESDYQEKLEKELRDLHPNGLGLEDIWTGDGEINPNSWLTTLRHGDSTTIEWGAVAGVPQTGWILTYTNFERLYYNLTVNFVNWLRAGDQLQTWTYMSNIRTESEDLLLSLFSPERRQQLRNEWTVGFPDSKLFDAVGAYKEGRLMSNLPNSDLGSKGVDDAPRGTKETFSDVTPTYADLVEKMVAMRSSTPGYDDILNSNSSPDQPIPEISSFDDLDQALNAVTGSRADYARNLPDETVIRATNDAGETRYYTVVTNRGYLSHDFAFGKSRARDCSKDYLSAHRGIVGNYVELFVDLPLSEATEFFRDVKRVQNVSQPAEGELNWLGFARKYAERGIVIPRESPAFWPFLDDIHAYLSDPELNNQSEAAILDVSEYVWFRGENTFEECSSEQ